MKHYKTKADLYDFIKQWSKLGIDTWGESAAAVWQSAKYKDGCV